MSLDGIYKIIELATDNDISGFKMSRGRTYFGLHTSCMPARDFDRLKLISPFSYVRRHLPSEMGKNMTEWVNGQREYERHSIKQLHPKYQLIAFKEESTSQYRDNLEVEIKKLCANYNITKKLTDLCHLIQVINSNHPFGDGHGRLTMALVQAHLIHHEQGQVAFWFDHNPNGLSLKNYIRMIRFGQKFAAKLSKTDSSQKLNLEVTKFTNASIINIGLRYKIFSNKKIVSGNYTRLEINIRETIKYLFQKQKFHRKNI